MERVVIYMTKEMSDRLFQISEKIGVSRSNLVSLICYEWLYDQMRPQCRIKLDADQCKVKSDN